MKEEIVSNTGSPGGEVRDPQPELGDEQAGPFRGGGEARNSGETG
jgi:hypothetical protein